jgi:hypothetical protein
MDDTERVQLRAIVKAEFAKHRFDSFVDEPPSIGYGGRGVVVPGCSMCRVRLQTTGQFVDHLCEKVQAAVDPEFSSATDTMNPANFPIALHKFSPLRQA